MNVAGHQRRRGVQSNATDVNASTAAKVGGAAIAAGGVAVVAEALGDAAVVTGGGAAVERGGVNGRVPAGAGGTVTVRAAAKVAAAAVTVAVRAVRPVEDTDDALTAVPDDK